MNAAAVAASVRASRGLAHKRDVGRLGMLAGAGAYRNGDDCAAIPAGDGYLLLAIEGLVAEFVAADPWFAGYSAVMVNASDVAAMGGRTTAVVDALWCRDVERGAVIVAGMRAAAAAYGIPLVGGHTNSRDDREQIAVAILGRANRLLTSFDARPGDALCVAVDLRGAMHQRFAYFNASVGADPERLRGDLEVLPRLAESGRCRAAKDVSMAGVLGTALMLLEGSEIGATVELDAIPRPAAVPLERWLAAFPSYGFVLALDAADVGAVGESFASRGICFGVIGTCDASRRLIVRDDMGATAAVWDLAVEPLLA